MDATYGKVTEDIALALKDIVGEKNFLFRDEEKLKPFGMDTLSLLTGELHIPDVVVKPGETSEVSKIMKLAGKYKIPVTPRGAGTGLAGSAIPVYGGIVLSLERMNRILEINPVDRVAEVEPGVITNELCKKVLEQGLMYAGYPMSTESSFIGGNVATNAGGGKVIKYGNTRKHILGLEVVLPNGEILELGGRFRKSTWGYDLMQLMIGSEGTLGIVTRVTVNLISGGGSSIDLIVPFPDAHTAVQAVSKVIVDGNILPVAVEFMDRLSLTQSAKYHDIKVPFADREDAGAYLIIQLHGSTPEELEQTYEKTGEICLENGALDVFVAENRRDSENIWKVREEYSQGLGLLGKRIYSNPGDFVVPFSKVPAMIDELKRLETKYNMLIPTVGHIADGNLHTMFIKPDEVPDESWLDLAKGIYNEMTDAAIQLGGVGSGEHGIGVLKKPLFLKTKSPMEIELMRGIKKTFDPDNILNPGKIFS
ncbi:MAG: FAD-binding oxidoreductase [Desulfobacteraceae bacterium]|nr:FAD-binding oxidoreductase [Desulfobacteraceae bacterium]MBU4055372.1 FAD-binding oxidoreductase [Pseudomonadota bacterium]